MKLPLIRQDRANHFIYGFLAYTFWILFTIVFFFIFKIQLPLYIGIFLSILVGLWKENKDEKEYGGWDWIDFLYTILPSIILYGLELLNNLN